MTEIVELVDRKVIVAQLIERDGAVCQYLGCDIPFDDRPNSRHSVTIDHIFPQSKARRAGWSEARIWDLSNLQLMGRACNSKKSDRVYDENGILPGETDRIKVPKTERPVTCGTCANGRLLIDREICDDCGSGPQPVTAPKYLQRSVKDCDHDDFYCWMCYIGHVERKSALSRIIGGP